MTSRLIPTLRYREAPKMIDWLCDVVGFEKHLIVDDGAGGVVHAQLTLGSGMIMLGTEADDAFGKLQATPTKLGGTTQSAYVVVPDADIVYAKAKAAGAEIVMEIRDEDYGGRGFCFRDPEGHLWNIGTYDPWVTPGA
ncbi:MAG: VOC family protein [Pseudomonadota bacterium]